jgi:hypothetical protein
VTYDFGNVVNLDEQDNVSYPIMIAIATQPDIAQNVTVTCYLTAGAVTSKFFFDVVPRVYLVSVWIS